MTASATVSFAHEYPNRLRVGFAGCGGQAYRNLLPSLAYAPMKLMATCDVVSGRAETYARQFGAPHWHADFGAMLQHEPLDAVLLAVGYDAEGIPLYPEMAIQAMRAGVHVWIEKPPAASAAEVERMQQVAAETQKKVGVGFMKMFGAGARKVYALMRRPEFGTLTSVGLRDPEKLPRLSDRGNHLRMMYFLDHIVHTMSLLHYLAGPLQRFQLEEGPDGSAVFTLRFTNQACGYLHLPWGQSGLSPKERLELVGEGANIVLENNAQLKFYRPGSPGSGKHVYGRVGDFTGRDDEAPWCWEMDCYSGQLLNNPLFYAGYAPELIHFAQSVLAGTPLRAGTLGDAWHVLRFVDALRQSSNSAEFGPAPEWTLTPREDVGSES